MCASHRIKAVTIVVLFKYMQIWTVTFPTAESFQTKNYSHEFKAINVNLWFSFSPSASYFFTDAHDSQHPNPCVKCVQGTNALLISPRHRPLMSNTFPVGRGHNYTDRNQDKNPESTDFTSHYLVNKQQVSVTLDWHSHIMPPCRYKSSIYSTFKCPFSLRVA